MGKFEELFKVKTDDVYVQKHDGGGVYGYTGRYMRLD